MPNLASISALPSHSPVALQEGERASGKSSKSSKENGADPKFGELVREQAGPLQSLSRPKLQAGVADDPGGLLAASIRGAKVLQVAVEDKGKSDSGLAQPDTSVATGVKTAVAGKHPTTPGPRLIELGVEGKPAVAAGDIKEGFFFLPKQALTGESGKPGNLAHSDLASAPEKKGKIDSSAGKKEKPAVASPPPGAGQGLIALLSASSAPAAPAVLKGIAPGQTATVHQPQSATEIPGSAQGTGEGGNWLRAKESGLPAMPSPTGPAMNPASPENPGPELNIPGDNGVEAAKPSKDAGTIKAAVPSPSPANHVNSEKLLPAASMTIAPTVAHGSDGVSVYGPQHQAPLATSSAGPAVSSSVAVTPNVYDRIDQGAAPVLLHSGVQHVSVGMHDPDLGWVEIQTQSAAGHVDATLVTSSGQTQASLAAQLPAMAQYLEQRDVRVGALVVHHHALGGGSSGAGNGGPGYGSANAGAGGHPSDSGNSGGGRASQLSGRPALGSSHSSSAVTAAVRPGEEGAAFRAISYISVRA